MCVCVDIFITVLFLDVKVCAFILEEKLVACSEVLHQLSTWNMSLRFLLIKSVCALSAPNSNTVPFELIQLFFLNLISLIIFFSTHKLPMVASINDTPALGVAL